MSGHEMPKIAENGSKEFSKSVKIRLSVGTKNQRPKKN